jgi:hypothetical protein
MELMDLPNQAALSNNDSLANESSTIDKDKNNK